MSTAAPRQSDYAPRLWGGMDKSLSGIAASFAARIPFCRQEPLDVFRKYESTAALGLLRKRCYLVPGVGQLSLAQSPCRRSVPQGALRVGRWRRAKSQPKKQTPLGRNSIKITRSQWGPTPDSRELESCEKISRDGQYDLPLLMPGDWRVCARRCVAEQSDRHAVLQDGDLVPLDREMLPRPDDRPSISTR